MLKNDKKFINLCKKLVINGGIKIILKKNEELILKAKIGLIDNVIMEDDNIIKLYYDCGYSNKIINLFELQYIYNNCLEKIDIIVKRYGIDALEKLSQLEEVKEVSQGCLTRKRILELLIDNNINISFDKKIDLLDVEEKLKLPIDNLSLQSYKKLKREKINTVYDLINFYDISKIRGLDVSEYIEIIEKIYGLGFINNEKIKQK